MTSISSSNVSAQRSPIIQADIRSKSCDTVCTSNSSCFFKKRKPMNPLAYSIRPTYHKANNNPVKQRVMSAKLLKLRQLQSQLNDANFHLVEVARENQVLKTLQKRQDKALSKYENTNADLPRLLHSHEEEIRVLSDRNKNLKKHVKDLTEQLKLREDELLRVREQLSHLEKLNRDKHLVEREKLTDQMEDMKIRLQKSEEQVIVLNRKLILEGKTSRQRLNSELTRYKQSQRELLHALDEIDRLSGLLEAKENVVRPRNPRFLKGNMRDSVSLMSLKNLQCQKAQVSNEKLNGLKEISQTPVTEVKLEPLGSAFGRKDSGSSGSRKNSGSFRAPMENIKQRLTGDGQKNNEINGNMDDNPDDRETSSSSLKNRPSSSVKLEKLPMVVENQKTKSEDVNKEVFEEKNRTELIFPSIRNSKIITEKFISEERRVSEMQAQSKQVSFSEDTKEDEYENSSGDELTNIMHQIKREKDTKLALLKMNRNKLDNTDGNSSNGSCEQDAAIQRATENSKEEFDKKLGNYCSEVLSSVKNCNKVIEVHKESLLSSKKDTNSLIDTLRRTEAAEHKLKNSFFDMNDDMSFVQEILNEEYKFQLAHNDSMKNPNQDKKPLVNLENKKKLLATLRAIDNGDSIESLEESKPNMMKEIFGHIAH
ncbi:lebercilin-like protein isoform X2 [Sitophilus oryzae]|uniref:Lebercilin-like protein isoform X2 n=1 Tax=Sitophilus oryzae TaxID=7048 RepID=A0A6J2YDA9_SITOR|nr:lebercilin-like protein isoform X2 [Sitophilus oryzae]